MRYNSLLRQLGVLSAGALAATIHLSSASAADCGLSQNGMTTMFPTSWTVSQVRQCNDASSSFVQSFGQFSESDLYFPNGRVYAKATATWYAGTADGWKNTSGGPCMVNGNGGFSVKQIRDARCGNGEALKTLFAQFSNEDYFFTDASLVSVGGKKYGITAQKEWKEIGSNCAFETASRKMVCNASGIAAPAATTTTTTTAPSSSAVSFDQQLSRYESVCRPAWTTAMAGLRRESDRMQNQQVSAANPAQLSTQEIEALNKFTPASIASLGFSAHFMYGIGIAKKYYVNGASSTCVLDYELTNVALFSPLANYQDLVSRLRFFMNHQDSTTYSYSVGAMLYLIAKDSGYTVQQVIDAKRDAGFDMTIRTTTGCVVGPCPSSSQSQTNRYDPADEIRSLFASDDNSEVRVTARAYLGAFRQQQGNAVATSQSEIAYAIASIVWANPFSTQADELASSFSRVEWLGSAGFPMDAMYYPYNGPKVISRGVTYGYDGATRKWKNISASAATSTTTTSAPVQTQTQTQGQTQTQTTATTPPANNGSTITRVARYSIPTIRTAVRCVMYNAFSLNGVGTVQAVAEMLNHFAVPAYQAKEAIGGGVTEADIQAAYNAYGSKDWITPLNSSGKCAGIQ